MTTAANYPTTSELGAVVINQVTDNTNGQVPAIAQQDTMFMLLEQKGVACLTGRPNCLYKSNFDAQVQNIADIVLNGK